MTWLEEEREERTRFRAEVRVEFSDVRRDVVALRQEMHAMEARLTALIANVKSDLMKWSFVFWCGAVTAVAALAGVLRH